MEQKQEKALPSVEYSLKYISWNLKDIKEELKKLNDYLANRSADNQKEMPF